MATSAYTPELLKEIILRVAARSEVQAAASTRQKQLMKDIFSSKAILPDEDNLPVVAQPSAPEAPEAPEATSTYNPELLKEIILRVAARSEVQASTSTRHKQLMGEIVSSKATIPDEGMIDPIMHYFTTRWPDRSIDAHLSTATPIHQAAPRASTENRLVALKCRLLLLCFLGVQLYVSWRLAENYLKPLIECNRARHALAQATSRGAGMERRAAY